MVPPVQSGARRRRVRRGFVIVWGSRSVVANEPEPPLQAACPACRQMAFLWSRSVQRYFTLFFLPICSIGAKVRFTECSVCRNQFRMPLEAMRARLGQRQPPSGMLPVGAPGQPAPGAATGGGSGLTVWGWGMIGAAALFMLMVVFAVVVSAIRESARHSRQQSLLQQQQQFGGGGTMAVPRPRPAQPAIATPADPQGSSGHNSPLNSSGAPAVRPPTAALLGNPAGAAADPTKPTAVGLPTNQQQQADQQRLRAQRERNETDRLRREADAAPTLPNLAKWVASDDQFKRGNALAKLRDPKTIAALADANTSTEVRDSIHDSVCALVQSSNRGVRLDGLRTLAAVGRASDVPMLSRLSQETGTMRDIAPIAAAVALRLDPNEGMKLIDAHPLDRAWTDRVGFELRQYPVTVAETLALAMLPSKSANVRRSALMVLQEKGTPAAVTALQNAELVETDPDCRRRYPMAVRAINDRATR